MKLDVILAGVGGQGILTVAAIIGNACMNEGLMIKQAEVHGMSQRGGDVQSHLRIADGQIFSDLIPKHGADVIISLEPMEALRYLPWLNPESGWIITSSARFVNIPGYPSEEEISEAYAKLQRVVRLDVEALAKQNMVPRSANVLLLGAASKALGLEFSKLEEAVRRIFARKGEEVVEANVKALAIGAQAALSAE